MRLGLIIKLALLGSMALVVALIAVAKSIDVSAYRTLLVRAVHDATGRDLAINGRLSLRLSLDPALVARDVELSNASWDAGKPMLTAHRLEANIGLVALMGRQVRINRLAVEDAELSLERNARGQVNWDFGNAKGADAEALANTGTPTGFSVSQVAFSKIHVAYKDAESGRTDEVSIDHLILDAPIPGAPVGLLSSGSWNGRHYDVFGTLGSAGEFNDFLARRGNRVFPVKLKAVLPSLVATADGNVSDGGGGPFLALKLSADTADLAETGRSLGFDLPALGAVRLAMTVKGAWTSPTIGDIDAAFGRRDAAALTVKGQIRDPLNMKGVDLVLMAEGPNPTGFYKPSGIDLPTLGPLKAQARFGDLAEGWRLGELKAAIGKSDIAGDMVIRLDGKRPSLVARFTSAGVYLDDPDGDVAKPAERETPDVRLFPDQPLPFKLLQVLDLDLDWKIDRLTDDSLLARQVRIVAGLKAGRLSAQPSIGSLAGGKVKADIQVDVTGRQPQVQLTLDADKVELGEVLNALKITEAVRGGASDFRLRLKGSGATPHAIMAKANGESLLVAGKGHVESADADSLAVDLFRQLAPWEQEKNTEMQCLISRFLITDGLAKSDTLLFDSNRMTVAGQGSVNLGSETLDLTVMPRPKEAGLLSLAAPVDVQGTMGQPSLSPNKGTIVKGMAGSGLGAANPCLAAAAQIRRSMSGRFDPGPKRLAGK